MEIREELNDLFILLLCQRSVTELIINFKASLENPYTYNLAIKSSWFMVSKAFHKSIKTAPVNPLLSRVSFYF